MQSCKWKPHLISFMSVCVSPCFVIISYTNKFSRTSSLLSRSVKRKRLKFCAEPQDKDAKLEETPLNVSFSAPPVYAFLFLYELWLLEKVPLFISMSSGSVCCTLQDCTYTAAPATCTARSEVRVSGWEKVGDWGSKSTCFGVWCTQHESIWFSLCIHYQASWREGECISQKNLFSPCFPLAVCSLFPSRSHSFCTEGSLCVCWM